MASEIRFIPKNDITAYELSEFVITPDGVGGGGGGSATANGPCGGGGGAGMTTNGGHG